MRPTPIPDAEVWEGAERHVVAGPDGDLTSDIRAVEVLAEVQGGYPCISARLALDPGDLERLAAGEPFWLTIMANHLHPFDVKFIDRH